MLLDLRPESSARFDQGETQTYGVCHPLSQSWITLSLRRIDRDTRETYIRWHRRSTTILVINPALYEALPRQQQRFVVCRILVDVTLV